MCAHNGSSVSHLNASSDDAVHLLFHFRIPTLHCIEIKFLRVITLEFAGSRTSADTDAVSRSAYLNDKHSFFGVVFFNVSGVDLPDTTREHDLLDPAPAF